MKKMKNIFKSTILTVVLACCTLMTSCVDFLTIYPTDTVIHDKYWQTIDDVNGVLAASYLQLLSDDAVQRYILWGEVRADNMIASLNTENDLKYIIEANILPTNPYCKWDVFYTAINDANLLLRYAPMVVDRDPNFTNDELKVVMGEMYAVRALCHFYLVRAFRDVPLSYTANLNDHEMPEYKQVHPTVALDSIMNDLNRAENMVMRSGGFSINKDKHNYGRITANAVRAIKADVALWQAAFATFYEGNDSITVGDKDAYYRTCIDNCETVIKDMNNALIADYNKLGITIQEMGPGTENPYYLLENAKEGVEQSRFSMVYDEIFGFGNSRESIFELQFDENNNKNGVLESYYGRPSSVGKFCVPTNLKKQYVGIGTEEIIDLRMTAYTGIPGGTGSSGSGDKNDEQIVIAKYVAETSPALRINADGTVDDSDENFRDQGECDANWIFYRKTDVMLMMAEALTLQSTATEADLRKAFDLVKAVNDRSIVDPKDSLEYADYTGANNMHKLVLDERNRELMYEGKRWFDLVRKALCEKRTDNILFVTEKLVNNSGAVKSKMASINTLFFPIAQSEIDVNPNLKQNPAYKISESITQK
ncbi:MAG: RagB/SusD family nutrient uptake outer membrane protein [Bacteroidaceae bacterium]|nr:RagB/SusD family nutrient uptake outer membrane protein [Bacteroidaceae bacterium]